MKVIVVEGEETKWDQFKCKFQGKAHKAKVWAGNHFAEIMMVAPLAIGLGTAVTKGLLRRHNLAKAEELKTLFCYDRSLGHYWELRRKLTNKEWITIEQRRKAGERLADILADLRVLK